MPNNGLLNKNVQKQFGADLERKDWGKEKRFGRKG